MNNKILASTALLFLVTTTPANAETIRVAVSGVVYHADNSSGLLPIGASPGDPMTITYDIDDQAPIQATYQGGINYDPAIPSMTVEIAGVTFAIANSVGPPVASVHQVLDDNIASPDLFRDRLEYTLASATGARAISGQISLMDLSPQPSTILQSLNRVPVPTMFASFPYRYLQLASINGGDFDSVVATVDSVVVVPIDADGDGIVDKLDNCPGTANANQLDSNADGYGDACVHPTVIVPPSASINHFVWIGANTLLGTGVTTGANVTIGTSSALKQNVVLGAGVQIGDFVVLNQSVQVGDDFVIGAYSRIDRSAQLLDRVTVGLNVQIGQGAVICSGARLGDTARIGRNALVQRNAVVPSGVSVASSATAPTVAMCYPG